MRSNVDSDVPSLSSLILHLNESAFNLRDEQTREMSLRNEIVTLGVENAIYSTKISRMSRTREAELMQSVTLPATCKRTRAFKSSSSPKAGGSAGGGTTAVHYPAITALSRRHAWYAFNYWRFAIVRTSEWLFSSRMLFSRDSSTRCSPNVKRRVIATRACGTEEPARRVRVSSASLISMLYFLSHESQAYPQQNQIARLKILNKHFVRSDHTRCAKTTFMVLKCEKRTVCFFSSSQ